MEHSNLTVALSVLGVLVLAALVAHGAWQARKAGPKRAVQGPPVEPREPVMDEAPREPVFGDDVSALDDGATGAADLPPAAPVQRRLTARIDALIDAIAPLAVEAPVSGDMALGHLPPSRRAGSKPFLIEGLNADSSTWEPLQPGQRYRELQAGVQLANRTGALNEIEYSEFVQKVQAFAEAVGAMPDFPDMLDVVSRARELDAFASQYDAQLAVHLRTRSVAWSIGYLQQQAGLQGFTPGALPGRLVLPGAEDGSPPVLTIAYDAQAALADDPAQAVIGDATLSFDVPQTAAAAAPVVTWQATAQALATAMDADLVDDNGQPLVDAGFAAIGGELGRLYEALEARDLAAGSPAARRLFS